MLSINIELCLTEILGVRRDDIELEEIGIKAPRLSARAMDDSFQ